MSFNEHEQFMTLALELADGGRGFVEPNPMVGAVIVRDGVVIGQGFHEQFGCAHAEVNAIADCRARGNEPAGAVMYVTLEPCCHTGKTGPCSRAVIAAGIAKVFVAAGDPSAHVGGGGIAELKAAGVEVEVGLLGDRAEKLNPGFYKLARTQLPWVLLKWAQSTDGFLAWKPEAGKGQWISNELSRADVHMVRRSMGAILVGVDTVIADDPELTVRPDCGRYPLRVALDSGLRIPMGSKLLAGGKSKTAVFTTAKADAARVEAVRQAGAEVEVVDTDSQGHCDIEQVLRALGKRGVNTVMVEGGAKVLNEFVNAGQADQVRIYIGPIEIGDMGSAHVGDKLAEFARGDGLADMVRQRFAGDECVDGVINKE